MCKILLLAVTVLVGCVAILWPLYGSPLATLAGRGRVYEFTGNRNCKREKSLQACETLVLHEDSGLVYLACSKPYLRTLWLPNFGHLNKTGAGHDHLAIYNPETRKSSHIPLVRFAGPKGFTSWGLDVVTSSANASQLFLYAVNNRAPWGNPLSWGPDAVVEIFEGDVGGKNLKWVKTVEHPFMGMVNGIVGMPDGKSFYITNAARQQGPLKRGLDAFFRRASSTVTYCHVDTGCKTAASKITTSKGIARGTDGVIFVASTFKSEILAFERQADDTLVLADTIKIGGGAIGNLWVDKDGALYATELPRILHFLLKFLKEPKIATPSAVRKITINTDESSFYGQKYKIEKIFEDDGRIVSGVTTAAYDIQRKRLYLHGIMSPQLVDCEL